jgi:tryptophan halogenase
VDSLARTSPHTSDAAELFCFSPPCGQLRKRRNLGGVGRSNHTGFRNRCEPVPATNVLYGVARRVVGEATTFAFPNYLHGRPQVTSRWQNPAKPNGYYCYEDFEYADVFPALMSHDKAFLRNQHGGPHIGTDVAYHIENRTFVAYLETYVERLGIAIHDDLVLDVKRDEAGVAGLALKSGRTETADLYREVPGGRAGVCDGPTRLTISKPSCSCFE